MRRAIVGGLGACALVVAAVGCATAVEPAAPAVPPREEVPTMPTLTSITEAVLADAARRTGLDKAGLTVETAETVTWADGALGCPQPGMSYTMALVPGYRIKVRAGGQLLDYHASRRGFFVLCPAGRSENPVEDPTR